MKGNITIYARRLPLKADPEEPAGYPLFNS
jgi:hypothetical protein